jgi:hypothetical protein
MQPNSSEPRRPESADAGKFGPVSKSHASGELARTACADSHGLTAARTVGCREIQNEERRYRNVADRNPRTNVSPLA